VADDDQLVVDGDRRLAGCQALVPVGGDVGAADARERAVREGVLLDELDAVALLAGTPLARGDLVRVPLSASANEVFPASSRDTYAPWSISDSTSRAQRFASAFVSKVFTTGG